MIKRASIRTAEPSPAQGVLDFAEQNGSARAVHPRLQDPASVLQLLEEWQAAGWVQQLDIQFARFLHTEQPASPGLLLLAAALASHQLGRGHLCLDLGAMLRGPGPVLNLPPDFIAHSTDMAPVTPAAVLGDLSLHDWEAAFPAEAVSDGSYVAPLVYERGRLYLYRYWQYEQQVAHGIAARVQSVPGDDELPAEQVGVVIDTLFGPARTDGEPDWQRLACALAARRRFFIITGGPGTGKTTTVVRLLAMLQALQSAAAPLRIRLAAPTGKAAARLGESIAAKVGELPFDKLSGGANLVDSIPTQVSTLHRLLGGRPHVQARRYHAGNPLPLDVLVIDEASMVSLSDMAHVIDALPAHAQLVLIGDKDQLSSVEAGAVLGELCRRAQEGHYLPSTIAWVKSATGIRMPPTMSDADGTALDQSVAMLRFSHRFGEHSGIGKLATAVNEGKAAEARALLERPPPDLSYVRTETTHSTEFARLIIEGSADEPSVSPTLMDENERRHGYRHYLTEVAREPEMDDLQAFDAWGAAVLRAQRAFQVLCVVRNGQWGVEGLNVSIARSLHECGLIPVQSGWYVGRPVMVTRNNSALRLTNGDIGVVLRYPRAPGHGRALRVAFPDGDGVGVRWFAPNRLDHVETVYALTVHKSQGSEFQHAALVLPPTPTPVLTRELVYTGITRASQWFTLVNPGGPQLLKHAVQQRVYRSGGLGDVLDRLR